jgi:NADPH2:quinone reductase
VNVVLDMVAGDYVGREIECLADDGRLAIIAVQGGTKSTIDTGPCCASGWPSPARRCVRAAWPTRRTNWPRALRAQAWPLIEAGRVKPVIHQVFPAAQAARRMR